MKKTTFAHLFLILRGNGGGGGGSGAIIVDELPATPKDDTLYILTTDWSINIHHNGEWHSLSGGIGETTPFELHYTDGTDGDYKFINGDTE